jgi:hypothetical protein
MGCWDNNRQRSVQSDAGVFSDFDFDFAWFGGSRECE